MTPDPEDFGLLTKVLGALAAVGLPVWGARSWLEKRFATKHNLRDAIQPLLNEQASAREHITRLYEQGRENEQRAQDRHERLVELLLNRKGD